MKISKIQINNFRLLKDVSLDMEDQLSLVIGKNNCEKTSLLLLLDRFLGKNAATFSFEDLNLDAGRALSQWISSQHEEKIPLSLGSSGSTAPKPTISQDTAIKLLLFIEYNEADDLSHVGDTMLMDLDPDNTTMVLSFEYGSDADALIRLKNDFGKECERRKETCITPISAVDFLSQEHRKYFKISRKSIRFDVQTDKPDFEQYVDLDDKKIN